MVPEPETPDSTVSGANLRSSIGRRKFIGVGTGLVSGLLAGCTGTGDVTDTPDSGGSDPGTSGQNGAGESTGTFRLLISDKPVAIDEFDSLTVSFDRARIFRAEGTDTEPTTESPTGTATTAEPAASPNTASGAEDATDDDGNQKGFFVIDLDGATVDLTQVVGEKALGIFEGQLPEGRYAKIELYATDVEGVVDGDIVGVKIPSEKLQIVKPFQVIAGETLRFVFDINVVKKGQTGEYNLLPVVSKSGVAGEDVEVEEVEDPDQGETGESETGQDGGDGTTAAGNGQDQGNGPPETTTGGS